jgi:hypothetical protein
VRHDPSDEEVAHRWLSLWRGKPAARWREDGEGGGGPVTRCGDEDEGERGVGGGVVLERTAKERNGGKKRGMAAMGQHPFK